MLHGVLQTGKLSTGDVKSPELDDIYPTWDKKEGCNSCRKVTMTAAVVLDAALTGRAEAAAGGLRLRRCSTVAVPRYCN